MQETGTLTRRWKVGVLNEILRVRGKVKEIELLKGPFKKQIQSDVISFYLYAVFSKMK
jgi:hypothetical protein